MSSSSVSVLVLQWGETDLTERALDAVRRSRYDGPLELLVWDNGSPDGPGAVAQMSDVILVESPINVGFGPANNRLAERATGDLLLFLNNDAILAPSCLGRMVHGLTAGRPGVDGRVVAVAPQFRGFDGGVLELGCYLGDSGEAWQLLRGERAPRGLLDGAFAAHYGSAACLLVRRGDFLDAGGFDELFAPAYYEDADLCLRLTRDGGQVLVEPRAVAYHLEGGTAGTDELVGVKRFQRRNRGRFAARWYERLARLPPVSRSAALRHAFSGGDRPLVLWLMPDFLKPDQSGGHARVRREIEALVEAGAAVVVWSEHVGDHGRYGRFLSDLGVTWCGCHEPSRSLLGNRRDSAVSSLESLLQLDVWDAVVAWSADVAHRLGPAVREHLPRTPFVVDSAVLLYRQFARGLAAGAVLVEDLVTEKAWELAVYGGADGLIASSEADAAAIRTELPHLDVVTFDVGAYEPVPTLPDGQQQGSLVFLGSFIHPPNMDAIVWWVDEIVPRIERICGRTMPLRVIGSSAELVSEVAGGNGALDVVGWVEDLREEMARARAFVVPLRYGAGTKDKISIAMRYGVPTVTTSIGAESMPDGLHGALVVADEPDHFAQHVVRLMEDDQQWKRAAESTRRAAQRAWQEQELTKNRFVAWFSRLAQSPTWRRASGRR